jgi:hypothetical protein
MLLVSVEPNYYNTADDDGLHTVSQCLVLAFTELRDLGKWV